MGNIKADSSNLVGDEGVVSGLVCVDSWNTAWARAIARAWIDEAFKSELLETPEVALKKFGYDLPSGLKLTIKDYQGDFSYKNNPSENGWNHMLDEITGEVIMVLPPKPCPEEQGIAIADYEATGKTFPFTCA